MAVDVSLNPTFKAGIPKPLFLAPISDGAVGVGSLRYDVSPDGKQFLIDAVAAVTNAVRAPPITVVLNWQAGLKK